MTSGDIVLTASVLSLEPSRMREELENTPGLDAVQLDVMDGRFVANETYGPEIVASVGTALPLDAHLMVEDPAAYIPGFLGAGASHVTFHAEAVADSGVRRDLLRAIREGGATAGIALNPDTPISAIDDVVEGVDMVLLMTVVPGKGGQAFLGSVLPKIEALRRAHPGLGIQVDGGINAETGPLCVRAGATNLVVGSALFNAPDRAGFLHALRHAVA